MVLLFIDRTEPLLAREKENVSKAAKAALALLQPGWRLQALVITDQALPRRVIFDNCMPGNEKSLIGTIIDKPQRGHALEYDVEVISIFGFGYFDGSQPAVNGERPALPRNIAVNLDRFWKAYFGRSGAGQVTFE
mgnify:CR=1 FL=1